MRGQAGRNVVLLLLSALLVLFLASFLAGRMGLFPQGVPALSGNKVAVLPLNGFLEDAAPFLEELERYREMDDVKAIVVRIESPGGTIVPAQEIYEEIRKMKGEKPVLASLGNVAASGGYYVACAAEEIVANPGTLTGSIGVITAFPNYRELMNKIGVRTDIMKAGRYKDLGNPMREMTPEEAALEQSMLDNTHQQFIRDVALGRNRSVEEIAPLADGRTFTGEQAMEAGLVDRLGNLQDTIDRAAELSGIEGEPEVVYPEEKRPDIWEFVFQGALQWFQIRVQEVLTSPSFDPVPHRPRFLQ